jgi:hypothetical protein
MYSLSGQLLGIASQARDRANETVEANPAATPSDATVAIIFSAAATEAFINEVSAFTGKIAKNRNAK